MLSRLVVLTRKLSRLLRHASYRSALRFGSAAAVEHQALLRTIPCRTVVDIGANRGQFALVAQRCFPDARIVSFEPLAEPALTFRRVFNGNPRVSLHEAAVAPRDGNATMHLSRQDDSSSLLPITPLQDRIFPGTAEAGTRTVHVAPLRAFLRREEIEPPALLKLDVQGFELEALKGCADMLEAFRYVYVECSFLELYRGQALADDVAGWLRERGFALAGAYNTTHDGAGRAVQSDLLFRARNGSAGA